MASSFGGVIKLQGESEYQRALKQINSNLKVLSSEMNVVSTSYSRNGNSLQALNSKNTTLNKTLEQQKQRLAEATKMLNEAKTSTDSNQATINKWQIEVNKAQTAVNKTTNEIEKNKDAIDNLGKEMDDTSQETSRFGDVLKANLTSEVITKGISMMVEGLKKVGSALVDVGKKALDSYADYEQLVGGVDTLFKNSSKTIQNYANEAYKTAGMSANEYMETVTSFSASLLQSLGQDTEKASKYADQAIVDMSDNANKMGTSMAMIQNAYQGFAKQNYTMLDNLKLG